MSRREAERYSTSEAHVVISISSPGRGEPARLPESPLRLATVRLAFDDYDYEAKDLPPGYLEGGGGGPCFFTHEHAAAVRDCVLAQREHVRLVVCHCDAGLSRSPAVAAALSRWMNGNGEVAEAICRWVTVERCGFEEGIVAWNRLVHDTLAEALEGPMG